MTGTDTEKIILTTFTDPMNEEQISGMPICMSGFCLFDEEHTTSMPLDLAYKAVQLTAPDKAEHFL